MRENPLVIFDGRCGFCRIWIEYWKQLTGPRVDYAPSQEVGAQYPQIPPEQFSRSVQLVLPDGEIAGGARAVFLTLTYAPGWSWLRWLYDHLPGFAPVTEAAYRLIAAHRTFFYHLTRLTFGRKVSRLRYARVEWLFRRLLAVIYFIAFASLAVQVTGLIGARGILPAARYLPAISKAFGVRADWLAPGVFWFASSDLALRGACIAGAAISVLLFLGFLERASLVCLYILYLSFCSVGQDFLSFQWDSLLLEAGFLAIFLGNSKLVVLLFRWLLFRLTFLSGVVKLTSHDPVWRDLTALSYHYMTQPLPTPLAWYMYQLPLGFQRFSTAMVFLIELGMPLLIFTPRRWRFAGAAGMLALQVMILLTGNYTFFNLLTISLCVFLFDDRALEKLHLRPSQARIRPSVAVAVGALILVLSVSEMWEMFFVSSPEPEDAFVRLMSPFQIANTYGLFASMTVSRPEIQVEGSNDGVTWLNYEFRYKPGDLRQPPHWVAPYQPRLDWQMWFAALSDYRGMPWFGNFMLRLLQGSPDVLGLLARNPFPIAPPKYMRAELFDYSFTDFAMRRADGDWWKRTPQGLYFPAVSLQDVRAAR